MYCFSFILNYKYRDLKEEGFFNLDEKTLNRRFMLRVAKLGYSTPERLTPEAKYKLPEENTV